LAQRNHKTTQNPLTPSKLQQQIITLNSQVNNVNMANVNLQREIKNTIKALLEDNAALKRENTDLKAKIEQSSKS